MPSSLRWTSRGDLIATALCQTAREWQGGVDILINNAGVSDFGLLEDAEPEAIERAIATNLTAPVDLCRRLLPHLRAREQAQIVNIGSVFGNIGFAGNSVYCATKFGLRGFSEALRRELAGTNVQVRYYAPRATRTSINSSAANAVNDELRIAVDDPQDVAEQVMQLMQSGRCEAVLGWPERLFARINALVPRIVDRALARAAASHRQACASCGLGHVPWSRACTLRNRGESDEN